MGRRRQSSEAGRDQGLEQEVKSEPCEPGISQCRAPVGSAPFKCRETGGELVLHEIQLVTSSLARNALHLWSKLLCLLSR